MVPGGEASLLGDIHENHRARLDETAGGDGPVLRIVDRQRGCAGGHAALLLRGSLRPSAGRGHEEHRDQETRKQPTTKQECSPLQMRIVPHDFHFEHLYSGDCSVLTGTERSLSYGIRILGARSPIS